VESILRFARSEVVKNYFNLDKYILTKLELPIGIVLEKHGGGKTQASRQG